jgi:hypothetical protein
MDAEDDLVRIEPGGRMQAIGAAAALRLQAREGLFHVLPAPPDFVVMRESRSESTTSPQRLCRLSGEIGAPGALCDIIGFFDQLGWRGELVVFDGPGMRSLYFEQGHVVGATTTLPEERLGQVLYRFGVLTREQVAACLEAAVTGPFGEAAVRLGFVQRETLLQHMARQTEEIFYGALRVGQGMFYFLEPFDDHQLSSRQMLPIASLIREGVRRMHETRFFRARIPSPLHVPAHVPGRVPSQPDPSGVYGAIDGKRSVSEIGRVLRESEFVVTRTLFQLVQRGLVVMQPPCLEPAEIVETGNRAVALILRELDAIDQGDDVRDELAAFTGPGVYAQLFAGARRGDSALLDAETVVRNLQSLDRSPEAAQNLTTWLCEYAAHALFLARPRVRQAEAARAAVGAHPTKRLSERVSAVLGTTGAGPGDRGA